MSAAGFVMSKYSLENLGIICSEHTFTAPAIVEAPAKLIGRFGSNCMIGAFTYIQNGSIVTNAHIGRFCSIADSVSIGGGEHPTSWLSTHPFVTDPNDVAMGVSHVDHRWKGWFNTPPHGTYSPRRIETNIGNDVWIGHGAIIKAGVTIGHGSVVAAGAVVTKDISPYSIVAGVPAKPIRMRFDEPIIRQLLCLKWWDYDLRPILPDLDVSDIDACISAIESAIMKGNIAPMAYRRYRIFRGDAVLLQGNQICNEAIDDTYCASGHNH